MQQISLSESSEQSCRPRAPVHVEWRAESFPSLQTNPDCPVPKQATLLTWNHTSRVLSFCYDITEKNFSTAAKKNSSVCQYALHRKVAPVSGNEPTFLDIVWLIWGNPCQKMWWWPRHSTVSREDSTSCSTRASAVLKYGMVVTVETDGDSSSVVQLLISTQAMCTLWNMGDDELMIKPQ